MKILAFADTHGSSRAMKKLKKKAKNVDLVICLGDFTIFETNMEKVLKQINALGKEVILLHGNHEYDRIVANACKKFDRITFLHKKTKVIGNCLFMSYGGGGFSLTDKEFEKLGKKKFVVDMKKHKTKKSFLLLHGPPYGTALDELWMGEHCGNKSFRDFIKKYKPDYVLAGHIHECFGNEQKMGKSLLLNPGPEGKIITV